MPLSIGGWQIFKKSQCGIRLWFSPRNFICSMESIWWLLLHLNVPEITHFMKHWFNTDSSRFRSPVVCSHSSFICFLYPIYPSSQLLLCFFGKEASGGIMAGVQLSARQEAYTAWTISRNCAVINFLLSAPRASALYGHLLLHFLSLAFLHARLVAVRRSLASLKSPFSPSARPVLPCPALVGRECVSLPWLLLYVWLCCHLLRARLYDC